MNLGKILLALLINLLPIISFIYFYVGIRLIRSKSQKKFLSFSLFLFASAVYSLGYYLELNSLSFNSMLIVRSFEYLGNIFIPTFGIMFISELANIKLGNLKALFIGISSILWLFFVTNPLHHLIYKNIYVIIDQYCIVQTERNWLFYLLVLYYVLFLLYSTIALLKAYNASSKINNRRSFYFLTLAFQVPWLTIIFISAGLDKVVDPVPITILIMCGLFLINERNNNMFDSIINRWQGMFRIINQPAVLINKESEMLCNNIFAEKLISEQKDGVEEIIKKLENHYQKNEPVSFIIDSAERWFSIKTSDYDVKKQYTTYLLIDITELTLYQEKIRLSEQNYRTFFETMDDIILIGTKEGNIVYVNSSARKKLGYTMNEFIQMNILDVHTEENRKEAEAIFMDMFNGKRNICPLPLQTKTGENIPVETRVWFGEWDGRECVFGLSKDLSNEQEAMQKFNKFFDSNPALMAVSELPGRQFVDVNAAFVNTIGYSKDEIIGKTAIDMDLFIMPDKQRSISYELEKFGKITNYELKIRTRNGKILDGLFSGEIIKSQGKKYFLTVMIDITERKTAEEEKIRQSQLILSLLDSIPDLIFYKDTNGVYLGCNPQFEKFVGKSRNEIIGKTDEDLFNADTAKLFKHNDEEMFKLNTARHNEEVIVYPDGKVVVVDTIKTPYLDPNGKMIGIIGVSRDVSEKKKAEDEITYLSFHDQLTGLYNRRYYEKELSRIEGNQGVPLTLIMADVNGLKLTNDAFGHKAGDVLLQKTANILKKASRKQDIVARIGGDEFVILLPEANSERAINIIDKVNKAIKNEKIENGILSISIGYAIKNIKEDISKVFKRAEDEMYRYKLSESLSMRHKTIDLILNTLYAKNHREMIHSKRVGEICEAIAAKMDFDKDGVNQIRIAGLMHDIGKIGIDDKILNKAAPLSNEEWIINKQHVEIGYRILGAVNEFSKIATFVLAHHERWDGMGYPNGIKGEEIPIQARIIAIADSFDAMMNDRPYRKAKNEEDVIDEILECSGTQFDPEVVDVFINKVLKKE